MSEENKDKLTQRAVRFFNRYSPELDNLRQLLHIRLDQLALAYTLDNSLPRESVHIMSRVKTLASFLNKLSEKGWPEFYYATEITSDLVGTRVICWFVDDCYGMLRLIQNSQHFTIRPDAIEDYIKEPKTSGYRSIHVLINLGYDRVKKIGDERNIVSDEMMCEIQIRSKLQDAWGEFTHEVHYKVPGGIINDDYNILVAAIANRLASEDDSAIALRNILRKTNTDIKHEGFRSK